MQKFSTPCINTGDFAKLCNTNKRTLIYYHEIGLFCPAYIDEKGYRFYSETQCDMFFTITCLKELGMPLVKIRDYLTNRNKTTFEELLRHQKNHVSEEIKRLQRIEEVIHTKLSLIEISETPRITTDFSEITIEYMTEEYLILSDFINSDNHNVIFDTLCKHIGTCYLDNLYCGHPYGAMQSTEHLLSGEWGYYAYFLNKITNPDKSESVFVKEAGNYLTTYLMGDYYNIESVYQKIIDYINLHHLKVGSYIYKEAVVAAIATDDIQDYITKLSILIL